MQNYEGAKAELQKSIESKPDYPVAYASMAILLSTRREFAGALEQFKKAVALNPDNLDLRYDLGNAFDDLRD
jgi:Tfp pilus assembly protein PilF